MFAPSVTRAAARSSAMPMPAIRSYRTIPGPMACINARPQAEKKSIAPQQTRASSEHAIANPTLAGIEKRWEGMPPQEQADLWMQLRDRMKVDWHQMTIQEKKAAYYIAFGPHGPRATAPKGEGMRIFLKVTQFCAVSVAIFYAVHYFAGAQPKTMSKEWQEASNEYALREKMNPIYGISSEGYEGKGFVQSPPLEKS
ncbi:cytochrome c oxidase subunit IV-domain-containing protein [Aspergillus californicus]